MQLYSAGNCDSAWLLSWLLVRSFENFVRLYTETCWVHCNTKNMSHQGRRKQFVPENLARPVSSMQNSIFAQVHF